VEGVRESGIVRVGLVLSGGGAKGAYQAGVVLALANRGIARFAVIAGTSVGALNGVAVAANRQEELARTWRSMSFSKLMRPSGGVAHLIIGATEYGVGWILKRGYLRILGVLPALRLLTRLRPRSERLGRPDLGAVLFIVLIGEFLHRIRLHQAVGDRIQRHATNYVATRALLSEQSGLRTMVEQILAGSDTSTFPPTYVTASASVALFDPDEPLFRSYVADGKKHSDLEHIYVALDEPNESMMHVPRYIDISKQTDLASVADAVLQSAALPIFFPATKAGEETLRDGGLIDNVPVGPTLAHPLDLLIVVSLNHDHGLRRVFWSCQQVARRLELERIGFAGAVKLFDDWRVQNEIKSLHRTKQFPFATWTRPANCEPLVPLVPLNVARIAYGIVHIKPSEDLGGFLKGTVNFGRRRAKRLVEMGYHDLLSTLDELASLPSQNVSNPEATGITRVIMRDEAD